MAEVVVPVVPGRGIRYVLARRILVVEDEPAIRTVLGTLFGAAGHVVMPAGEVAAARRAFAEGPEPDLVLLDLLLPDGDGLDLLRELKDRRPGLPVVVITALSGAHDPAVLAGADLVVAKPFDPVDLEMRVHRLMVRATSPRL